MTGNDSPPAVSIGLLKKFSVPFLSLAQAKINTESVSAAGSKPISPLTQASPGPCLARDPAACFAMLLAEAAGALSDLPPPLAHQMETSQAGSTLQGIWTPLPTTRLPQAKSVTPAAPARLCSCPAGTCITPQPSAGENGGRRRPWHQVPVPGEGGHSPCPPGPAKPSRAHPGLRGCREERRGWRSEASSGQAQPRQEPVWV